MTETEKAEIEKSRHEFQEWVLTLGFDRSQLGLSTYPANSYQHYGVQMAWQAWCNRIPALTRAMEREERLRRCLGFFASVIKSGEPWTDTCQKDYDEALAADPKEEGK